MYCTCSFMLKESGFSELPVSGSNVLWGMHARRQLTRGNGVHLPHYKLSLGEMKCLTDVLNVHSAPIACNNRGEREGDEALRTTQSWFWIRGPYSGVCRPMLGHLNTFKPPYSPPTSSVTPIFYMVHPQQLQIIFGSSRICMSSPEHSACFSRNSNGICMAAGFKLKTSLWSAPGVNLFYLPYWPFVEGALFREVVVIIQIKYRMASGNMGISVWTVGPCCFCRSLLSPRINISPV